MAPTDPVLASEVQLEGPEGSTEEEGKEGVDGGEDEVRFALTSEAGLNDGFAFPFTNLAILMALVGAAPGNWVGEWLLIDVLFRVGVSIVGAIGLGWLLARLVFALPIEAPMAKSMLGLESLAAMFIVYGAIEFVGGYGFIGVFIAAVTLRDYERRHEFYEPLHDIAEQSEQLLMAAIMILFGGLIASGLFAPLTWQAIVVAIAIVFVIRPVAGLVALLGFERKWTDRLAISFFGVRGIGTFYYLAHGLNSAPFDEPYLIWAIAGLAILVSVVVHGLSATPIVEHQLGNESPS
ncbi:cation:proton antiporter [Halalkalicoccus tibetensis]|uniref:Cation:proton antiporter n=1 Tax=Halalkalicoccus tibetensis TaxID=175632 RepID=A0ABD5V8X7_9EURY